jgi:predicted nucleic acid-binding protein
MDLVIDANVLFSALIKNSTTSEILFNDRCMLFSPEFIIEEFMKYEKLILKKTKRSREEFIMFIHQLKERIIIVPEEEYSKHMGTAEKTSPDENDAIYFALALKFKCPIWSNDKRLKEQNKVKIISTKEIIEILNL